MARPKIIVEPSGDAYHAWEVVKTINYTDLLPGALVSLQTLRGIVEDGGGDVEFRQGK